MAKITAFIKFLFQAGTERSQAEWLWGYPGEGGSSARGLGAIGSAPSRPPPGLPAPRLHQQPQYQQAQQPQVGLLAPMYRTAPWLCNCYLLVTEHSKACRLFRCVKTGPGTIQSRWLQCSNFKKKSEWVLLKFPRQRQWCFISLI